jgi:hypothetical protein
MAENIKHFPVNWIEGMKINKNHFIELQDYIEDLVRDARNLEVNELNYGIISTNLTTPFQYTVFIDTHNELSVDIKMLKAITPSGGRIEITDYTGSFSEKMELKNFDLNESNYYLMLNVDPYNRVSFGEQNMEEIPPRFPNVISKYFLTNVSESEVDSNRVGPLQFPLAKFKASSKGYEILTNYIPPCITVNSHERLVSLFDSYVLFFRQLEINTLQIIKKIKFRNSNEDKNVIADMVYVACDKTLRYVEQHITTIKWTNLSTKPVTIFENIANLARILKNCFDTFSGDGKEMLFNYFSEWTDSKSGDFDRLFLDTINVKYKAFDIEETLNQILIFNSKMDVLFATLSQLDYIGKKRDTGIFVNENVLKNEKIGSSIFGTDSNSSNESTPSSSPSFLAD